ncbi:MOSC N-terminal beta barrel domain-containing protein [Streptomyces sp. GD-15H]|uniref:MOSC domain-containing protein n=1 Tax=Streptomyces sp. GD-15H TaxID=3129112 RepID=UPI003251FD0C
MARPTEEILGSVVSLWRYPVKSMLGEELNAAEVGQRGVLGDRAYALLDRTDGKVVSAKNPRKWPRLFEFRAGFADPVHRGHRTPPVRITLPDGTLLTSEQKDVDEYLSRVLGREVTLEAAEPGRREAVESTFPNPWAPRAEEYWPDMEGLDYRDTVTDFDLPEGTFFDCAVVHVLTTATLDRLRELYPDGRFEVRRFRPNVVVETLAGVKDFTEDAWIGRTVRIGGDGVRLAITGPCPRCVMTTLPQADLPKDRGILRTAARHNNVNVGVYASVLQGGEIRRSDTVKLE